MTLRKHVHLYIYLSLLFSMDSNLCIIHLVSLLLLLLLLSPSVLLLYISREKEKENILVITLFSLIFSLHLSEVAVLVFLSLTLDLCAEEMRRCHSLYVVCTCFLSFFSHLEVPLPLCMRFSLFLLFVVFYPCIRIALFSFFYLTPTPNTTGFLFFFTRSLFVGLLSFIFISPDLLPLPFLYFICLRWRI